MRPRHAPLVQYLRRALLPALIALLPVAAAQTIGFTPTILEMDTSKNLVTQTTLVNGTTSPARFEVTAATWRIVNGEEVLDETRDLVVTPAAFTVKPGGSQLIRLGLRTKPSTRETAYRLIVKQVPIDGVPLPTVAAGSLGKDSPAAVSIALTYTLPVYATPPGAAPKLALNAATSGANLTFTLENTGLKRAILRNVRFKRGSTTLGTKVLASLSGSVITLTLPDLATESGPLQIRYEAEDGRLVEQTLTVP